MILAKFWEAWVRMHLARNLNLCKEAQMILMKDEEKWVRLDLAENENIDKDVLEILLKDDDEDVREAAQKTLNKLNK